MVAAFSYCIHTGLRQKKIPKRRRKYCPICNSILVRLSQHLLQHHKILDKTTRDQLVKDAREPQEDKESCSTNRVRVNYNLTPKFNLLLAILCFSHCTCVLHTCAQCTAYLLYLLYPFHYYIATSISLFFSDGARNNQQ